MLGERHPRSPGAVLPEMPPGSPAGEIRVAAPSHVHQRMGVLVVRGVVPGVQPARRAGLVIHVKYFPLGSERFLPAVWKWSVEVRPAVLIGGHPGVVGVEGRGGRGAGGELSHHGGLLLVHGDVHGRGNLGLVRMARDSVHHLARVFPSGSPSVVAVGEGGGRE